MYAFFAGLGIWGPFFLSIVDALLFAPLANDILIVGLSAAHHNKAFLYATLATIGSMIGVFILDRISRKGGEAGLRKSLSPRRFDRLKRRVGSHAGIAIVLACTLPPPFPFTAIIAAASALQYPRAKLLVLAGISRAVRFAVTVWLAVHFGKRILSWAEVPAVRLSIIGLIVVSAAGSIWAIVTRLRKR